MPRRFKNNTGIAQVIYLPEWFRPYPTKLEPSAVIEGKNEREEKFLASAAERGILVEIASTPDESAIHFVIGPWSEDPNKPTPRLRNVSKREAVIHDEKGDIVASVLPGGEITGFQYLQFRRPVGVFRWLNPWPTPVVESLSTAGKHE